MILFLRVRRTPRSTLTDTRLPLTTPFRSRRGRRPTLLASPMGQERSGLAVDALCRERDRGAARAHLMLDEHCDLRNAVAAAIERPARLVPDRRDGCSWPDRGPHP